MRLYAEDPRTFLPQAGRLDAPRSPDAAARSASTRGVEEGDEVGLAYDPMIAKLIAHAPTREEALDALAAALAETRVEGVTTNLPFLRWLVAHPVVRAGETTTAFLTEHPPLSRTPLAPRRRAAFARPRGGSTSLLPPPAPPPDIDVESHRPARRRARASSRHRCPAR